MEEELNHKIEAAVVEILRESDMSTTSEAMVRSLAGERLGLDLSSCGHKLFVRGIVESFLASQQDEDEEAAVADASESDRRKEEKSAEQAEADQEEEEEEEEAGRPAKRSCIPKEYDDEGDLILCRLSNKRRVGKNQCGKYYSLRQLSTLRQKLMRCVPRWQTVYKIIFMSRLVFGRWTCSISAVVTW